MNKLVIIQEDVPICPTCNSGMKFNKISQTFICHNCKNRFIIIDTGNTEREFICKNTKDE